MATSLTDNTLIVGSNKLTSSGLTLGSGTAAGVISALGSYLVCAGSLTKTLTVSSGGSTGTFYLPLISSGEMGEYAKYSSSGAHLSIDLRLPSSGKYLAVGEVLITKPLGSVPSSVSLSISSQQSILSGGTRLDSGSWDDSRSRAVSYALYIRLS